jgi:hypothetical protein
MSQSQFEEFVCNGCETAAMGSYGFPGQRLAAVGLLIHWL